VVSFFLLAIIAGPVTLLALPESRRRAKVRVGHVVRVGVYGFTFFAIATTALSVVVFAGTVPRGDGPLLSFAVICTAGYAIALSALLPIWWYAAVRRYLRMEHATGVTVALVSVAYLAGIVAAIHAYLAIETRWFGA
jgi:hypothetical protein